MKKIPLLLFITFSFLAKGQNYQCLQAGVKHFFINNNNYLRGIRIDSVRTLGDTIVYYPFRTPRGAYNPDAHFVCFPELDTNGGSWLGKKVMQLNDGTFIFDSYWNNSVKVKTQANVGDSWLFYSDSSNLYYTATVVSIDTMTIISMLDSIKTIMITAHDGAGIVTSDPVNSFNIILSKNHGFVQVFDLYTFPYHKADSAYRLGLDFFLDRSTCNANWINSTPYPLFPANPQVALFRLTDFIIPNEQQLYNWNTGVVFEISHKRGHTLASTCVDEHYADTVNSKVTSGHIITYTLTGFLGDCTCVPFGKCNLIVQPGSYSFSDMLFPIADTSYIPENHPLDPSPIYEYKTYIFYNPDDTSFCIHGPAYSLVGACFSTGLGGFSERSSWKLGIGETSYSYFDGEPTFEETRLLSARGIGCGGLLEVNNVYQQTDQIQLFPNPATKEITIISDQQISFLSVSNVLGQIVYSSDGNTEKIQLDISPWPAGTYFVKINGTDVKKFVRE